jgi:hypothetical protein
MPWKPHGNFSGIPADPVQLHPEVKCYRQQYLKKNPYGYCTDHGTGVSCPIGLGVTTGTGVKAEAAES